MNNKNKFLPQYAAQAVIDLEYQAKNCARNAANGADGPYEVLAAVHQRLAQLIRSAVHVVLPDNGEIYRSNLAGGDKPTKDECDSFAGLPAPVTCFEYAYSHDNSDRPSPKRITIVVDNKQIHENPPEGYFAPTQVFSLAYDATVHKAWGIGTHIMLNLENPLAVTKSGSNWGFRGAATNLLTGELDMSVGPDLIGEMYSDITAVVQCCHALRAGAFFEERQEKSTTRRWKFDKRGVGGFTYHVLKLPGGVSREVISTGTHDSPRFHIRRAHIRKLPTGVLTFVRQCFVGDAEKGAVDKHYKVTTT